VLDKDGKDHLDPACEELKSIALSQGGEEYPAYIKRSKVNCIGHILHRNWLLKHVIEGKKERWLEMTGRRRRRIKSLLDDLKGRNRYWKWKEKALNFTLWRTRFGRGCELVRETTGWMNEL
jgi:hypothetical protein